jgi:hypothetical protein
MTATQLQFQDATRGRKTARGGRSKFTLDISKFTTNHKLSIPHRAAEYLNWAAKNYPHQYTPYNLMCQALMGYDRTPKLKNAEVERLRNSLGRIRVILIEKYDRDLVSQPGLGPRATVDDADKLKMVLPKKSARLASARAGFVNTANSIDPKQIPNTPELAALKDWFGRSVKDVVKQIGSKSFEALLLPPSTMSKPSTMPKPK